MATEPYKTSDAYKQSGFDEREFSDVIVNWSGRRFYLHKIFLARGSSYCREMFKKTPGGRLSYARPLRQREVTLYDDPPSARHTLRLELYGVPPLTPYLKLDALLPPLHLIEAYITT
nr:hypothetical protein B0A51_00360 [Rachicladosporium sp. CCFEE 5018]